MTKRDEILKAATECFKSYGYGKTSMSDIGKRVGLNKASLYYHFKDKLSLYEEVLVKARVEHDLKMKTLLEEDTNIDDKVIRFIFHEIDFWESVAINNQLTMDPEEKNETTVVVKRMISKTLTNLTEIIQQAIDVGELPNRNAPESAQMILELGQGLLLLYCPLELPRERISEGYEKAKKIIEKALRIFINGLKN